MQNIKRELLLRDDEVNNLIKFLEFMENNGGLVSRSKKRFDDTTTVMTSIKAGIVLMLYNAVESTITKGLERLHELLQDKNLMFCECNDNIKKLILEYYESAKAKSPDIHSVIPYELELYNYMRGVTVFELSYRQLSKFYSLYSGNLDSREIVSVLEKYGIDFNERISELKTIKENRNKLAHGELTFEEVGRNLSVPQLKELKKKTFEYMNKVIKAIELFVMEERYKKE